ncbi:DNA polymerase III subunit delta [Alkalihalobacillus alcalophilus ATCC 27647 = CGMCC 1.3604]|uniref:DNA polymerase III subunit delta n=1 Tax=Alkalihalobacillus alcalophilus ATCC 27647 = CGMCC 1.3604 TaxID=1218173 RepID=A0A094YY49_ALKAL|nr:DNA polymerase III subunit delta [Alkalihalobacillus alcalophilus]KGA98462.1 DNA polymerase III subunit delta [Alkalihalobacillus alcalophilus ATCC 27647 = CGMCC 1.3604]MED1563343.1 DNA polymerase III subunit delta [Alkalihalobacillus alcalophilus]THG88530.1 DNA polymerase III subunit delta [Alkalihalobacillus alcalophilus ATCC 27647 = CGMCC 1.3604]
MTYLKVKKAVEQGKLSPVYFSYGSQTFLMEDFIQELTRQLQTKNEEELNIIPFRLQETPIELIVEEAETISFFGGKKLVIIKDFYAVTSQKVETKLEHNFDVLDRYIKNPVEETIVVIQAPYEKLDERKKITKLLKKETTVVEANPFDERTLFQWIQEQAEQKRVTLSDQTKGQLLERVGTNLLLMATEIEKLSLYVGEGGVIEQDHIELLVARTLEQDIFALIDLAIHQKTDKALVIYHDLLRQKEEPLKILALLTRQFRIYYQVKELSSRGYSQKEIASQMKLHPYVVKLATQRLHQFNEKRLYALMELAAETDYAIKTGKTEKVLAVELLILRLATDEK